MRCQCLVVGHEDKSGSGSGGSGDGDGGGLEKGKENLLTKGEVLKFVG